MSDPKKPDYSQWRMFIEEPALAIVVIACVLGIFFTWSCENDTKHQREEQQMETK
jgi:hypothetical protein